MNVSLCWYPRLASSLTRTFHETSSKEDPTGASKAIDVKTRDSKHDPEKLLISSPEVREGWGG